MFYWDISVLLLFIFFVSVFYSYSGSTSCTFFILRIFKTKWNTLWWICFTVTQFNIFTTVQWKHMLHEYCQILNEKWLGKKKSKNSEKVFEQCIDCHENLFMKNVLSLTRNVGSLFSVVVFYLFNIFTEKFFIQNANHVGNI